MPAEFPTRDFMVNVTRIHTSPEVDLILVTLSGEIQNQDSVTNMRVRGML